MADLDTYKDKVIVFEAVKVSDTSRLITRQPLRPTNTQLLSPPSGSLHKSAGIKPILDGASDENITPSPAMPYGSLHQSRAMHGQALYAGTWSNTHSLSPSGRMPQVPHSNSHTSGSTFRSSTLPHSSVRGDVTPHSRATTPLSTSNHAFENVDMAGFDRYHASWHDRLQVSYPGHDDGTHVLVYQTLPMTDPWSQDKFTTCFAGAGSLWLPLREQNTQRKQGRPIIKSTASKLSQPPKTKFTTRLS